MSNDSFKQRLGKSGPLFGAFVASLTFTVFVGTWSYVHEDDKPAECLHKSDETPPRPLTNEQIIAETHACWAAGLGAVQYSPGGNTTITVIQCSSTPVDQNGKPLN